MIPITLMIVAAVALAAWLRPWPLFPASRGLDVSNEREVTPDFAQWVERRARGRGLNVRGVARRVPVKCPKCGENSNYFVYPDEACERCWLLSLKPEPTSRESAFKSS